MSSRHVLVLGGHGKIAQLLTPLLLQRSWTVTSVIRSADQQDAIKKLGEGQKGKLNVLLRSLEDVKSEEQAASILDEVKPDYVVWSAGAGGKGGASRTFAIDRDAAVAFIRSAAAKSSGVRKFLLVSYLGSRLTKPSWWSDADWASSEEVNNGALSNYYKAKVAADEELYKASKANPDFVGIDLRPGTLSDEPVGKVELGKTKGSKGQISRASVAEVAARLLDVEGVQNTWLDLLDGEEGIQEAVEKAVRDGVNAVEGEPFR